MDPIKENDSAFGGTYSSGEEDDSVFSIFNKKEAPPAPAPAPASPLPFPSPLVKDLPAEEPKKAASGGAQSPVEASQRRAAPEPGIADFLQKKISELEKRLYETQEKALSFSLELKNKDELQRQAMQQAEDMFKSLRSNQRAVETEKRLEEKISRLEQLTADLGKQRDELGEKDTRSTGEAEKKLGDRISRLEQFFSGQEASGLRDKARLDAKLEELEDKNRRTGSFLKDLAVRVDSSEERVLGLESRVDISGKSLKDLQKHFDSVFAKIAELESAASAYGDISKEFRERMEKIDRKAGESSARQGVWGAAIDELSAKLVKLGESIRQLTISESATGAALKNIGDQASGLSERMADLERIRTDFIELKEGRPVGFGQADNLNPLIWKVAALESALAELSTKISRPETQQARAMAQPPTPPPAR